MWIVRLALRRPYTFVVMSILILILGGLAIVRTPTDIFPNIDIPVVSIIWNYNGLVPQEMSDRIVTTTERNLTTTVDNIEHIESQSLYGIAVVKVFLQPTANIQQGIAQITAVSQTQLRQLPAGSTPPLIIAYSASSVPVLQLALSGQNLSEQQLNDYGLNFIRTQIITVPGTSVPYPYGGKQRQVQVDLNTTALQSKGLSPLDVVNAIAVQNLILPTGTSKIGSKEYDVSIPNAAPQTIADLNRIPIKTIGGTTIYIKDVAWVRDGFPPQTNIVRVNGQRSVLLTIQKAGNASTLDVIAGIKALLPQIKTTVPSQLDIAPLADQSIFVRGAISGVVRETLIAACLTAFMILTFLGSWRSTVIIATSIPLAILTSIIALTIVPTMAKYLLRGDKKEAGDAPSRNPLVRLQKRFEEAFEKFRQSYRGLLEICLHHRRVFLIAFFASCLASLVILIPWLGRDFFPSVDAGSFKLHMRAPTGMRIEETANLCDQVERSIRAQIPASEVQNVIDNIGLPYSGINLSYSNSAPVGTSDADIMVTLAVKHHPTDSYIHQLRLTLPKQFPGVSFAFLPADMVGQILNFGLPAPIDVQVVGNDLEGNRHYADVVLAKMRYVPGTADLRIQQPFDQPYLRFRVERTKAEQLGFSAHDIAQNLLVSLSGSFQTSPTFWLDPKNHVSYQIATQTPQYRTDTLQDLENIPITGTNPAAPPSIMASLVSNRRGAGMAVISDYNVSPVIDIFGAVTGRDLGAVAGDINKILASTRQQLPRGSRVVVRGQVQTMRASYNGLLSGLLGSIVLVYLLIVVNFQSWLDPFIMISALPAALAGIAWF